MYLQRQLEPILDSQLKRRKSVLLLGPRQTGKTTLLQRFPAQLTLNFIVPSVRQRYEKQPELLADEIALLKIKHSPLVVLDEVQRVPEILDVVQDLIDRKVAQFILTGSSARKLKRRPDTNLLPGRVVSLRLDPLSLDEAAPARLEDLLLYGSLPGIHLVPEKADKERELESYVETYLEEEIRAEALVRQMGPFSRFLELAALESGQIMNFRGLASELGLHHNTIASYFELLEDCLIAERVDPLTRSRTRKKLTRSSRYLIFDLGVRRIAASEGPKLGASRFGQLFEQWVGLELLRHSRRLSPRHHLKFWRDPDGPEVDWVLEAGEPLIPIEVKWKETPNLSDVKHLQVFLSEYREARHGYVVCRTPRPFRIQKNITALPWEDLYTVFR